MGFLPEKIISGGQTGVDRGALDAATEAGLAVGGWCPKGRRAEDGPIPDRYRLRETPTEVYSDRTKRNVAEGDATLILCRGPLSGGTAYTAEVAAGLGKPLIVLNPDEDRSIDAARLWLDATRPRTLNVAGPRDSSDAGIERVAAEWMNRLLSG